MSCPACHVPEQSAEARFCALPGCPLSNPLPVAVQAPGHLLGRAGLHDGAPGFVSQESAR